MPDRVPNPSRIRLALACTLLSLYLGAVLAIAFYPAPVDRNFRGLLDRVIDKLHENGVPSFVDYGVIEALANVALFIPVGLLIAIAVPKSIWWITIFIGPLISIAIEVLQGALLPERFSTVNDVVANSIGCLIGATLGLMVRMLVAHRDELVIARHEHLRVTQARRVAASPLG